MNTYRATILQFGRFWGVVEIDAESPSAVSQCFIDHVGDFDLDVEGLALGDIELATVPSRYANPTTLFEHLVVWHLDEDTGDLAEAIEEAEDQAKRLLQLLERAGLDTQQGARSVVPVQSYNCED